MPTYKGTLYGYREERITLFFVGPNPKKAIEDTFLRRFGAEVLSVTRPYDSEPNIIHVEHTGRQSKGMKEVETYYSDNIIDWEEVPEI